MCTLMFLKYLHNKILRNLSPIFFNQLIMKHNENTQNNLSKMKFLFFEIEIWCIDQDCIEQSF